MIFGFLLIFLFRGIPHIGHKFSLNKLFESMHILQLGHLYIIIKFIQKLSF